MMLPEDFRFDLRPHTSPDTEMLLFIVYGRGRLLPEKGAAKHV